MCSHEVSATPCGQSVSLGYVPLWMLSPRPHFERPPKAGRVRFPPAGVLGGLSLCWLGPSPPPMAHLPALNSSIRTFGRAPLPRRRARAQNRPFRQRPRPRAWPRLRLLSSGLRPAPRLVFPAWRARPLRLCSAVWPSSLPRGGCPVAVSNPVR